MTGCPVRPDKNNNNINHIFIMKHSNEKSSFYCPPEVGVIEVTTGGVLCASQHESYQLYDGNDGFEWED